MFIYFVEQVWDNEDTIHKWGWPTEETQRRYWEQFNYSNRGTGYPHGSMEEGVDYVGY